jgi:hypothetical protein
MVCFSLFVFLLFFIRVAVGGSGGEARPNTPPLRCSCGASAGLRPPNPTTNQKCMGLFGRAGSGGEAPPNKHPEPPPTRLNPTTNVHGRTTNNFATNIKGTNLHHVSRHMLKAPLRGELYTYTVICICDLLLNLSL